MNNRLTLALVILAVAGAIAWRYWPVEREQTAGPPMVDVVVPDDLSDAAAEGEAAFTNYCAGCHGTNAAGQQGVAPPLIHIIYEPNHHGDAAFFRAAKLGVPAHHWRFGDMPPVDGISDDEIGQIVAYVRALQSANGIN